MNKDQFGELLDGLKAYFQRSVGPALDVLRDRVSALEQGQVALPDVKASDREVVSKFVASRLAGLEARLTELERRNSVGSAKSVGSDEIGTVVRREIEKSIVGLSWRIGQLEDRPTLVDAGVYAEEKSYLAGNGVSQHGSFWIAQRAVRPGEKPGACDAWRLAVKRGADAPRDTSRRHQ